MGKSSGLPVGIFVGRFAPDSYCVTFGVAGSEDATVGVGTHSLRRGTVLCGLLDAALCRAFDLCYIRVARTGNSSFTNYSLEGPTGRHCMVTGGGRAARVCYSLQPLSRGASSGRSLFLVVR